MKQLAVFFLFLGLIASKRVSAQAQDQTEKHYYDFYASPATIKGINVILNNMGTEHRIKSILPGYTVTSTNGNEHIGPVVSINTIRCAGEKTDLEFDIIFPRRAEISHILHDSLVVAGFKQMGSVATISFLSARNHTSAQLMVARQIPMMINQICQKNPDDGILLAATLWYRPRRDIYMPQYVQEDVAILTYTFVSMAHWNDIITSEK